ncbi:branched-chain amino acid ABC transporter permease [Xanthobacter tagetidis]|uniref:Branched-chain amino acid ABC transporter permease n=1 Tax=Xanthobacter tagetidis TaxID=60216 RepID=A0A3L7A2D8_9HYPH|nr:branched-chain amino acid ABC transporter permease [Xanthobacter tagetidis]MBB6309218.1 branched-chain amino acid transport system permease protein [Xanthobacter tagetidis]RLP74180.1 branched-chain amino acid ABC transporter permease [Xanthobacter tagetidis]
MSDLAANPALERRASGRGLLIAGAALVAVAGALVPFWTTGAPFLLMLASQAVIAAILALSLDLLTGNTGLLSFGHAAWFGFGAYVAGLLAKLVTPEMLIVVPTTVIAACLVAAVTGAVLVRQIGKTFAILTLALSQIMFALVFVASDITGGEDGLQGVPVMTVLGQPVVQAQTWYWLLYGVLLAALAASLHIRRSPLGRAWLSIRENAERARFIGIDVNGLKLLAFVMSAGLGALAGALLALFNGAASPDLLSWFESGKILMFVVLGGVGTLVGPVLGGIVFTFAEHYVSSLTSAWLIYFGGLFILIVIVAPGGIFGVLGHAWRRMQGQGR